MSLSKDGKKLRTFSIQQVVWGLEKGVHLNHDTSEMRLISVFRGYYANKTCNQLQFSYSLTIFPLKYQKVNLYTSKFHLPELNDSNFNVDGFKNILEFLGLDSIVLFLNFLLSNEFVFLHERFSDFELLCVVSLSLFTLVSGSHFTVWWCFWLEFSVSFSVSSFSSSENFLLGIIVRELWLLLEGNTNLCSDMSLLVKSVVLTGGCLFSLVDVPLNLTVTIRIVYEKPAT